MQLRTLYFYQRSLFVKIQRRYVTGHYRRLFSQVLPALLPTRPGTGHNQPNLPVSASPGPAGKLLGSLGQTRTVETAPGLSSASAGSSGSVGSSVPGSSGSVGVQGKVGSLPPKMETRASCRVGSMTTVSWKPTITRASSGSSLCSAWRKTGST